MSVVVYREERFKKVKQLSYLDFGFSIVAVSAVFVFFAVAA
jgi:hypothetical protein